MISAFVDETRGFGFEVTAEELARFNIHRREIHRPEFDCSPGMCFLEYGKNKEGWWDYAKFAEQVVSFMDMFEFLYPNHQLLLEVDHSSGHAKHREDGLHTSNMNVTFGGKQKILHASIVDQDCLGDHSAVVRWDSQELDLKLKVGDVQSMVFLPTDPPPFYALNTPKYDMPISDYFAANPNLVVKRKRQANTRARPVQTSVDAAAQVANGEVSGQGSRGRGARGRARGRARGDRGRGRGRGRGQNGSDVVVSGVDDGDDIGVQQAEAIVYGYVGKPKGKKQVLFERGLWVEGMKMDHADPALNMDMVLSSYSDFKNEKTALQDLVESRGHILLMSPKCHPELAGLGIEYNWGKSKLEYRQNINDEDPAHLHDNILKSVSTSPGGPLPIARVRKFARKTRDYRNVYRNWDTLLETGEASLELIEKMRKKRKTHRNIVDIEMRYLLHASPQKNTTRANIVTTIEPQCLSHRF
eukprot:Pompholyxophrys_punicea_v1_NODE_24_length_5258_cov_21.593175.p1 type:complete len:471 gc:universal NODE_24_length_5258_cov_21.593175:1821-3233(+)